MVWDHKGQQQGASFSILIYLVVVDPPTRILAEGEVLGSFKGLKGGKGSVLFSSFNLRFSFPLLDNLAGLELLTVLLVFEVVSGLKISSGKLYCVITFGPLFSCYFCCWLGIRSEFYL